MARKTAIRISNAEIGAAEARADARRDAAPIVGREPSTLDLIRAKRDHISDAELLKLARSAARLVLQGKSFDAEDRADCAAEIVWTVLAKTSGAPPVRGSKYADLTFLCGLARNWRRALLRRRDAEDRARRDAEDRLTMSGAATYDLIESRAMPAETTAGAAETAKLAHKVAARMVEEIGAANLAVYAAVYQWVRDADEKTAAADNECPLSAWKMRVQRGRAILTAIYPDPADLVDALLGAPEERTVYRGVKLGKDWRPREGTNRGDAPIRPETAETARELCLVRHQCPVPGLAEIGRARIRRGYFIAAPSVGWAPDSAAPRGFLKVPGKTAAQHRADALTRIAREHARGSSRERAIAPREIAPHGIR